MAKLEILSEGNWWSEGPENRIFFSCVLNKQTISTQFDLREFVQWYEWDGRVAGQEAGFHCTKCDSLLAGSMAKYGNRMKLWPPD